MQIAGLQYGSVTSNQDPDQMGRVQVSLPDSGGVQSSSWASVLQPMAGSNYGIYFVPEVGDQVLVGFIGNNHDYPIVLGALFNSEQSNSYDANNYIKCIQTKAGNQININDKPGEETILITNPQTSNYIALSMQDNGKITIESTNGLISLIANKINIQSQEDTTIKCKNMALNASGGIDVKGGTGISLQSDDNFVAQSEQEFSIKSSFETVSVSGLNVDISANVGATVKGNATAELSASGQTTVKGGMVMIN